MLVRAYALSGQIVYCLTKTYAVYLERMHKLLSVMSKFLFRYCLSFYLLFSVSHAFGQSQLQLEVYGQVELASSVARTVQLSGINPGLTIGFELDLPEADGGFYLRTRWERVREDSSTVHWIDPSIQENLLHDNLAIGPGFYLVVFPEKKIQMLVGLEMFFGIPLRTEYEFFGPGTGTGSGNLPSYASVSGGASRLLGWQGHLGFRGKLVDQVNWNFRFGYGAARQSYNWESRSELGGSGDLFTGTYFYTSVGVVYVLHNSR